MALRNDRADAAAPVPSQTPVYWVCLALVLALIALAARIAGTL